MSARATHPIVVAGLGSEYRHDDGVGPEVARRVAECVPGAFDIGPIGEPLDLLGRWDDADLAVIIDAVRSGEEQGRVSIVELALENGTFEMGESTSTSTHGIGLIGAMRIAHALGRAPRRVVVVAIAGDRFEVGVGLTPAVRRAIPIATKQVIELLGADR